MERHHNLTQVMIDKLFSFAESGFHEQESSKYITAILEENGFDITYEVSGIPTAWFARWGSGEPVIALGSDLDGIPKASQKPGVAYRSPIVDGAPGHGEGHNSGDPVSITAALAVKEIQYEPMISEDDRPAIHLNSQIMEEFRPKLKEFYFDESRYNTYQEQLGIRYPTLRVEP